LEWSSKCHGYRTDSWKQKAAIPKNKPTKGRFSNLNNDESDAGVTGDSEFRDVGILFVENLID
jgi:hypothetical protein